MTLDPIGAIFDPKKDNLRLQIIKPEYKDEPSIKTGFGYGKLKSKSRSGPFFDWNDRDIKAYLDVGLDLPQTLWRQEARFLREVDIKRGPVVRTVRHMVRLKAPDYSVPTHERKEYVYYLERWEGVVWRGVAVNPVNEHLQGVYTKRAIRPVYDQRGEIASYKPDPTNDQKIYYIPWSKKAVEEILSKSAPVNKDGIVYTIKFASEDFTFTNMMASRAQFSYDQFATWKWEDVCKWYVKPTVKAAMEFFDKNKTGYNLTYEPS